MKRTVTLCLLAFLCFQAQAGDYSVEIEPSKKIIYIDKLGLPSDTNIEALLTSIPELIKRGEMFDSYDIQYDGKSVGESRDVIIVETRIAEIEKIEVTTSSVRTQSRDGQSGTINLVPKKLEEGFGGEAFLGVDSMPDIMPSVNINYATKKLELRGHAGFEYYHPKKLTTTTEQKPLTFIGETDLKDNRYIQETAKLNLKYKFDDKNTLKAWVLESYRDQNNTTFKDISTAADGSKIHGKGWYFVERQRDTLTSSNRSMFLSAKAEYEHLFNAGSKIVAYAGFETSRQQDDRSISYPGIVDGEIKYEGVVLKDDNSKFEIKPGVNFTYNATGIVNDLFKNYYLSPYFDCDYRYKNLWVNATARYQYYGLANQKDGYKEFLDDEHDFVGNLNALWQIKPHHAVHFAASRNIVRPTDMMLYPGCIYYSSIRKWVLGNPDLRNSSIYGFEAGYITDQVWGEHSLVLNADLGYDHAVDLIEERLETGHALPSGPGVYSIYENSGISDIARMALSAVYKYNHLTLYTVGNMFCRFSSGENGDAWRTYYNISVGSILNLAAGWSLNVNAIYHSMVETDSCVYGDRLLATARVTKDFGRLSASLGIFDIFDYISEDYTETPDTRVSNAYDLYGRSISVTLSYRFSAPRHKRP